MTTRREVLVGLVALGAASAVPSALAYTPPTRTRGTTVLNVKNFGARGDGLHDDTNAINNAIAALPTAGGTVYIPAGTYLVDTTKRVNLRSNMLLQMDADTKLKAKTSTVKRAYILYSYGRHDVEIAGGQLIGERDTHKYYSGTTDEWNMGIEIIGGQRITIRDLWVGNCTGDGICIGGGAYDVVIDNVVSTNNRRQGLSITKSSKIRVYDSEFSYTNGTSPECGIDIEPDLPASCTDIIIDNCSLKYNAKYGINVYKNARHVTVRNCTIERNHSCGAVLTGCYYTYFHHNKIQYNSATGLLLNSGSSLTVRYNTFYENYTRQGYYNRVPDVTYTGYSTRYQRDLLKRVSATIGTNYYH
jgi:polygalacturonase